MPTPNPRRWWILGVLCLALLVLSVDNMILNLAIPSLMRDLGATPSDIQWILDAYILVFAGSLITAGGLSDRYGRRRALLVGLGILGGASLLAAFATEPWQLIACRALMGMGAAFAMPSTLSIIITVFDDTERRQAMAAWTVVAMFGVVAGPTLGGLLLQHYWWGSVFLINVPLAAVGMVAALLLLPESRGPARPQDPLGALLSIVGMTALVWAIISLPHHGLSAPVTAALIVAAAALTGFAAWESHCPHPMLPLAMFRNRDFTGASLSIVLLMFATGALLLALTQYLQFVLGYDPMKAGLAIAPFAVSAAVFNIAGATLGKHLTNRTLIVTGLLIIATAFGILTQITKTSGYPMLITALIVMGIGSGLAGPAVYTTLMAAIPPDQAGVGSAVNDTIQQAGMALSVAALGSVLSAAYSNALPHTVPPAARTSIQATLNLAKTTNSTPLAQTAKHAFIAAMSIGSLTGVLCSLTGALFALAVLRKRSPVLTNPEPEPEPAEV